MCVSFWSLEWRTGREEFLQLEPLQSGGVVEGRMVDGTLEGKVTVVVVGGSRGFEVDELTGSRDSLFLSEVGGGVVVVGTAVVESGLAGELTCSPGAKMRSRLLSLVIFHVDILAKLL